jgi:SAM-dependent methyltransferase
MSRTRLLPSPASAPESSRVTACRSCGAADLREFLSLGSTPVANALVEAGSVHLPDPEYPLSVTFCPHCSLVQLAHELPADALFNADYPYYSSFSDMLVAHSQRHVDELVTRRSLGTNSFVVEIASNDGYLLRRFLDHGVPVLGVEPTAGPAAAAREAGVPTLGEFFDAELGAALRAERGPADVVIANNVMAHVPDLNGFVAGMAAMVADDGVVQIENPGVRYLLEHTEFDTIYHEHFCYFSTIAVDQLLTRHGLHLLDVELFPDLHGGTLRWTAGRTGVPSAAARLHLSEERALGLAEIGPYEDLGLRAARTRVELKDLLGRLRAEGATLAAYGAAAKGATLLNTTGLPPGTIDFVVDRNPHKQGRLMPGVRLPILGPEALLQRYPDYVLLLAWNVRAEVVAQQEDYRRAGGRFIVPVPRVEII